MKPKSNKIVIGSFLVLGTILAAYITIGLPIDLYQHTTLWYRSGILGKTLLCIICLDFLMMTIAGIISCTSFFRNKFAWRPITKVIIINIILLLICTGISLYDSQSGAIFCIIEIAIVGLLIYLFLRLYKLVNSQ